MIPNPRTFPTDTDARQMQDLLLTGQLVAHFKDGEYYIYPPTGYTSKDPRQFRDYIKSILEDFFAGGKIPGGP